jgi:hypothetical protein
MTFSPNSFFVQSKPLKVISIIVGLLIAGCHSQKLQLKPTIEMRRVPPASAGGPDRMESIGGQVTNAKPGQQIVIYAKNDIWWVQPFWSRPLTPIQSDSTWNGSTHLGTDYAALLVEPGYRPQKKIVVLPVEGNGVVAVVAAKGTATAATDLKVIHFSGYDWTVRSGANDRGGEVNAYDPANAWTDQKGYLHLRMGESNGGWSSAEVSLTHSLGYGTYRFTVQDSAHLTTSGVLGMFTVDERLGEDTRIELDIELSQWGKPENKNAQYVVQPYYIPENIARFSVPSGVFTHILRWEPGVAWFKTVPASVTGSGVKVLGEHKFTSGIPTAAAETVHIVLYDFYHSKSNSQRPTEVVIEKFEYLP